MSLYKVKKYEDKRDWVEYKERLVKRGEIYLSLEFLENWDKELEEMNRGKRGRPYEFPNQFMEFLGCLHVLFLPYRQLEGFVRKLGEFVPEVKTADYTSIWWRVSRLNIQLQPLSTD